MKRITCIKPLFICLLIVLSFSPALHAARIWVFDIPETVNYDSTRLSVIIKLAIMQKREKWSYERILPRVVFQEKL